MGIDEMLDETSNFNCDNNENEIDDALMSDFGIQESVEENEKNISQTQKNFELNNQDQIISKLLSIIQDNQNYFETKFADNFLNYFERNLENRKIYYSYSYKKHFIELENFINILFDFFKEKKIIEQDFMSPSRKLKPVR